MAKSGFTAGIMLPVIAVIVAIISGTFVSLSNQEQVATLKNDIKALESELSVFKQSMQELERRTAQASMGEHREGGQLQPTVELMLQTFFTDGKFGFMGMGGNIDVAKNPTLHVKHGDIVKIMVMNGDGVEHDFRIEGLDVHAEHIMMKGDNTSVVFKTEKEGEFQYYCSIPGHKELGMVGKIIVEA